MYQDEHEAIRWIDILFAAWSCFRDEDRSHVEQRKLSALHFIVSIEVV
jgi:hypothetical protein